MKIHFICAISRTIVLLIVALFIPLIVLFSCQGDPSAEPENKSLPVENSTDTIQSIENGNYSDTLI